METIGSLAVGARAQSRVRSHQLYLQLISMDFLRRRRGSESDDEGVSAVHKSRRPPNTAFRQQRLKAWQPILTPKSVIPLLLLLAVVFAPLGIAIIHTTYSVEHVEIDYSHCEKLLSDNFVKVPSKYTAHHFHGKNTNPDFKWKATSIKDDFGDTIKTCHIQFDLPRDLKPPLYMYYKLTNFYQNHRKYVESYDLEQLKGNAVSSDNLANKCSPLKTKGDKIVYPCGLIANSLFNDTISSPVLLNAKTSSNNETYEMGDKDISWSSDRDHKYKKTEYKAKDIVPPPNWHKKFPHGYTEKNIPNLQTWEHFQNWMRTAGLPSFYKLYGKNTTETMSSGTYQFSVEMNYPTSSFGGTKSVIITTSSIIGGRNMSLGIIYIIVATISLVLGIAFLIQHLVKPRRLADHNYLQNVTPTQFRDQL